MTPSPSRPGKQVRALALGASLLLLLPPAEARAAEHRVTVLDPDVALVRALEMALSVWDIEVDPLAAAPPGATMPNAVERARSLARETRSDVVIWISASDSGHALWVYDAESDHAGARQLAAGPPFDSVTAAGIALAIKALLRASVVAPRRERFGAAAPEARDLSTWRVHLDLGAAARTGLPSLVEPRAGIAASVWPAAWSHAFGLSLEVRAGPGVHAEGGAFSGTLLDTAGRVAVAARIQLGGVVAVEPSLGGGLHLVSLDGFVIADRTQASVQRIDGALEPRLGVDLSLFGGRVHVGPWIGLSYLPRAQRFFVHAVPALTLSPVAGEAALRLTFALE